MHFYDFENSNIKKRHAMNLGSNARNQSWKMFLTFPEKKIISVLSYGLQEIKIYIIS